MMIGALRALFGVKKRSSEIFQKAEFGNGGVPELKTYYPQVESMNVEQRKFYRAFRNSWQEGRPISIDGNVSYVFCYAYEVIENNIHSDGAAELQRLADHYRNEEKVYEYLKSWAADCYIENGNHAAALRVFPPISLSSRATMQTDRLLNIKGNLGESIGGRDVLTLFGAKVTKYAAEHLDRLTVYLDIQIAEKQKRDGDLIQAWISDAETPRHPLSLFSGVPIQRQFEGSDTYGFSYNPKIELYCRDLTREAENTLREDDGIVRVGEGWVAETRLYYDLRDALVKYEVQQHARLEWLGRQHLDVYIPVLQVGIEFQGEQHDRPIEFFGGENAFAETQKRDARKKKLCTKNGVRLIEVRAGYDLKTLVEEIQSVGILDGGLQDQD